MTVELWDPRKAALEQVAMLLMAGHVVRLSRNGDCWTVRGGPLRCVRYVQFRKESA